MNKLKKILLCGTLALSFVASSSAANSLNPQFFSAKRDPFLQPKNIAYLAKQEANIKKSLEELIKRFEKDGVDKKQVLDCCMDSRFAIHRNIISMFDKSPEAKGSKGVISYESYRKNLGLDNKLLGAPGFLKRHKEELAAAERKYGVDRRYIVAILGVESDFGRNSGEYYAFNVMASLYATRLKEFAYRELKEYLALCNKVGKHPYDFKSSYAGALGYAQFIPSSFNSLFIGRNGDFKADPCNINDCIHSVAYYLKANGWNTKANNNIPSEGSSNWNALLRYNNSKFYVKAVIELATKAKWNAEDVKVVASGAGQGIFE